MATDRATADFILARLGHSGRFLVRSMFGEFALYADGKVVGFICDDTLFVKILPESVELESECEKGSPYPGAKEYYVISEDQLYSLRTLPSLLLKTAESLPSKKR